MSDKEKEKKTPADAAKIDRSCGLVMPISAMDGCDEQHWAEVKDILYDSIQSAGFEPSMVSDADDIGIIQKRIIQNLYSNPVVVCDVSGKNPNVMFELGLRLAFDKATIIVKDDKTSYSFDTSPIEHLEYPRDLRFGKIVAFKTELQDKLKATYAKGQNDPGYSTFLKSFGQFAVAKLDTTELSKDGFLLEEISELRRQVQYLVSRTRGSAQPPSSYSGSDGPTMNHVSPEECKRTIGRAVRLIQQMMMKGGTSEQELNSVAAVFEIGKERNLFPGCFMEDRPGCIKRLEAAMGRARKSN